MHLTITVTITISNTSYYYIEGQILEVMIYFCNYSHNVHHTTCDAGVCAPRTAVVTIIRCSILLLSCRNMVLHFFFGGGGQYC